uniref:PLD phosphodiesterase domain-containing protein n=1 Tax=Romanomermis culicivorax TaxID=13658 RepID=A0A915IRZ6_ROMCU
MALESICPFEYKNTYSIKQTGQHIIVDDYAFFIKSSNFSHRNCPDIKNGLFMEQGVLITVNTSLDETEGQSYPPVFDLTDFDPANAKLNFLALKMRNFEIQNFRTVWNELCRQAQQRLDLIWKFIRHHANLGTRAFLQRNDITAQFRGGHDYLAMQAKR